MYVIILLTVVYGIAFIGSLIVGAVPIPLADVINWAQGWLQGISSGSLSADILTMIRLPRTIAVAAVGSILAIVGVYMQTITRNALAEPYVLGISSGAGAGAVAAIVWGVLSWLGPASIIVSAFIGSIISTVVVLVLVGYEAQPVRLVLVGMGVSAFFSALTTFMVYAAHNEAQVRSAMFWLVGSFSGIQWATVPWLVGVAVAVLILGWWLAPHFDVLLLGREGAGQLGLSVREFQYFVILISALAMAVAVSSVGVIGFVGLIVPHIARILVGPRHARLFGASFLLGGACLCFTDMVGRVCVRPEELPIGIITALLGAPLFVYMISRGRHRLS